MPSPSPYEQCPLHETPSFVLRLVDEDDAADLLQCYSDPRAVALMNSDNCNSDFHFTSLEEMQKYIRFWLAEYAAGGYVRFSIVARESGQAVGTIEIFGRKGAADLPRIGVLRIDLRADYEQRGYIRELLTLAATEYYGLFGVDAIVTKAVPAAVERVAALTECGFAPLADKTVIPYEHYYAK